MTSVRDRSVPTDRAHTGGAGRSRWRIVLAGVLVVVVALVLGWVVLFSPLLSVRTVAVRGQHRLSATTVLARAQIVHGSSLVRLDRGAIRKRVEALPDVASAQVSVSLPSTVRITVVERTAAGYLQTSASTWVLVDETGHSFTTLHAQPAGLPRLQPTPTKTSDAPTLAALAQVAVRVPASVRAVLATVSATGPDAVTLVLTDKRTVYWGSPDRSADKARILPTLLKQPGSSYDVSDPDVVSAH